jgi:cobyrinic acid a,c-diamide synthase
MVVLAQFPAKLFVDGCDLYLVEAVLGLFDGIALVDGFGDEENYHDQVQKENGSEAPLLSLEVLHPKYICTVV